MRSGWASALTYLGSSVARIGSAADIGATVPRGGRGRGGRRPPPAHLRASDAHALTSFAVDVATGDEDGLRVQLLVERRLEHGVAVLAEHGHHLQTRIRGRRG